MLTHLRLGPMFLCLCNPFCVYQRVPIIYTKVARGLREEFRTEVERVAAVNEVSRPALPSCASLLTVNFKTISSDRQHSLDVKCWVEGVERCEERRIKEE